MEKNVQYVESDSNNVFYIMDIVTNPDPQTREELCAEGCGKNPACKSWSFNHSTKKCAAYRTYMPGRKPANGYTSGLPKRVTTKNLDDAKYMGVCCGDQEIWSECGIGGTDKCPQGWNYVTWKTCGFFMTNSKCRKTCAKKDFGCGCQEFLEKNTCSV